MYMPGRRRTGSRPSRTVMSFAEYDAFAGDFAIKGNACKTPFCGQDQVYQTGRSDRRRARPKLTAFCTLSRSFSSATDAAISAARRRSSVVGETAGGEA